MDLSEITTMLGTLLGVLTPLGGAGAWFYRKQNKRLKEAETKLAEVNVDKGRIEAKKQETDRLLAQIDHQQSTIDKLTERNEKLVQMNAEKEDRHQQDIKDWQDRFDRATDRTREVQREREQLANDKVTLVEQIGELKLDLAKLKCEDTGCPFRKPPTADTPPMPDMTRDRFHTEIRLLKDGTD